MYIKGAIYVQNWWLYIYSKDSGAMQNLHNENLKSTGFRLCSDFIL